MIGVVSRVVTPAQGNRYRDIEEREIIIKD